MKKLFTLICLICSFSLSASLIMGKTEDKVLQEIHQAYESAVKEGPRNDYSKFRDYCLMFLNMKFVKNEIKTNVDAVMDMYDSYFSDLLFICEKHPNTEISKLILKKLRPFLDHFDRYRVAPCFLLFQFGIGDLEYEDDEKELLSIVIEYAVKNRMVDDAYEHNMEVKEKISKLVEKEKLAEIRRLCERARDPYLSEVLYKELLHIQTLRDYWDKYTFSLKYLDELEHSLRQPVNHAEEEIRELLIHFSHKIEHLKQEYGEFIGM